jgi:hypothetical protein
VQHSAIVFGGRHTWTSLLLGASTVSVASEALDGWAAGVGIQQSQPADLYARSSWEDASHMRVPDPSLATVVEVPGMDEEEIIFGDDGNDMIIDSGGNTQHIASASVSHDDYTTVYNDAVPLDTTLGSVHAPWIIDGSDVEDKVTPLPTCPPSPTVLANNNAMLPSSPIDVKPAILEVKPAEQATINESAQDSRSEAVASTKKQGIINGRPVART